MSRFLRSGIHITSAVPTLRSLTSEEEQRPTHKKLQSALVEMGRLSEPNQISELGSETGDPRQI
jgi:hypothetical protein